MEMNQRIRKDLKPEEKISLLEKILNEEGFIIDKIEYDYCNEEYIIRGDFEE